VLEGKERDSKGNESAFSKDQVIFLFPFCDDETNTERIIGKLQKGTIELTTGPLFPTCWYNFFSFNPTLA
jgi:hypothetical protein